MAELKIGDKVYCNQFGSSCIGRVINIEREEITVKLSTPIRKLIGGEHIFKKI